MAINLSSLGWGSDLAAAYALYDRPSRCPARVVRVDSGVCTVMSSRGLMRATLAGSVLAAIARDPRRLPCVGDWVVTHTWPDRRITIETVLPRRSAIAGFGANIDVVAAVEPAHAAPDRHRIARLLAVCEESGARPVIVLSGCHLVADPAAVATAMTQTIPVYAVSTRTGFGVEELRSVVADGRTMALLGTPGAGLSDLVHALAGTTVLTLEALRADGRGTRTVGTCALVPLPGGGAVLSGHPETRPAGNVRGRGYSGLPVLRQAETRVGSGRPTHHSRSAGAQSARRQPGPAA
jgi:ribosome biogenesis GTPase / thiamine phosphate phosphatase